MPLTLREIDFTVQGHPELQESEDPPREAILLMWTGDAFNSAANRISIISSESDESPVSQIVIEDSFDWSTVWGIVDDLGHLRCEFFATRLKEISSWLKDQMSVASTGTVSNQRQYVLDLQSAAFWCHQQAEEFLITAASRKPEEQRVTETMTRSDRAAEKIREAGGESITAAQIASQIQLETGKICTDKAVRSAIGRLPNEIKDNIKSGKEGYIWVGS
ncbi:MAG: hypothetical protein AAGB26_08305 [Planctomycetota bacterium]